MKFYNVLVFFAFREEITQKVQAIIKSRISDLRFLWADTFERNVCELHLTALTEHVNTFFDEVHSESLNRQKNIKARIQGLKEEAENLKRLLQINIELEPPAGLPLYSVQCYLDENLEDMRKMLKIRKDHIYSYLQEQKELTELMGENTRILLDDPLPSEEQMQAFRQYLNDLKSEKSRRIDVIRHTRENVKELIRNLGIELQSEEENALVFSSILHPTKSNIHKLECLEKEFSQQFDEMRSEIDKYRQKLDQLWTFLQISSSIKERFGRYYEYNQITYGALYEEYNRCETIKRENIEKYVQKIRNEINLFWDVCFKSQAERERFTPFKNLTYNQDLLTLHEMELAELKSFYEDNQQIFNLYGEQTKLWDHLRALDLKANDPNRYNNRGGQLLKEEKERKTINARIPKIQKQLSDLCEAYKERTNKDFTINGKTIEEIIQEEYERFEEQKTARKKPPTTSSTPMNGSRMGRTPQTGSALKNMTRNNIMSGTRTGSTLKNTYGHATTFSNMKRKLSPASAKKAPHAKRNLLPNLTKSTSFLRPTGSALKAKSPAMTKGLKRVIIYTFRPFESKLR